MKQNWHDILEALTHPQGCKRDSEPFGRLELMLIRLHSDPDPDEAKRAAECIDAFKWSDNTPQQIETQLVCIIRLGRIFNSLGLVEKAHATFHNALIHTQNTTHSRLLAIVYMELGELARRKGDLDTAAENQKRAMHIADDAGLDRERADAVNNLANTAIEAGDLEEGESLLSECLNIAETIGELRLEGHVYNNLGVINCMKGRFSEALSDFSRALSRREQAGDPKGMSETLHNMGLAYLDSGDLDNAAVFTQKALDKAREIKDQVQETHILLTSTELIFHSGDFVFALSMADHLAERQTRLGNQSGLAETQKLVGMIYMAQGILDKAESYLSAACDLFRSLHLMPGEAETLKTLGLCLKKQGLHDESVSILTKARELFQYIGNQIELNRIDSLLSESAT